MGHDHRQVRARRGGEGGGGEAEPLGQRGDGRSAPLGWADEVLEGELEAVGAHRRRAGQRREVGGRPLVGADLGEGPVGPGRPLGRDVEAPPPVAGGHLPGVAVDGERARHRAGEEAVVSPAVDEPVDRCRRVPDEVQHAQPGGREQVAQEPETERAAGGGEHEGAGAQVLGGGGHPGAGHDERRHLDDRRPWRPARCRRPTAPRRDPLGGQVVAPEVDAGLDLVQLRERTDERCDGVAVAPDAADRDGEELAERPALGEGRPLGEEPPGEVEDEAVTDLVAPAGRVAGLGEVAEVGEELGLEDPPAGGPLVQPGQREQRVGLRPEVEEPRRASQHLAEQRRAAAGAGGHHDHVAYVGERGAARAAAQGPQLAHALGERRQPRHVGHGVVVG